MPTSKIKSKTKTKTPASSKNIKKTEKYFEATGRRKTAVARVRLYAETEGKILVNGKEYTKYFSTEELITVANAPLRKVKLLETFSASVKILGGGVHAQAEAMRHGVARALIKYDPELRLRLKKSGYLKRDPRETERKKPGLKKARRAPQWSKR